MTGELIAALLLQYGPATVRMIRANWKTELSDEKFNEIMGVALSEEKAVADARKKTTP